MLDAAQSITPRPNSKLAESDFFPIYLPRLDDYPPCTQRYRGVAVPSSVIYVSYCLGKAIVP
jgi:hypothetical protein